jgi:hypothetical protein
MTQRLLLVLCLSCLTVFLSGCAPFEQQSNYQWQQMNRNYRPPVETYP